MLYVVYIHLLLDKWYKITQYCYFCSFLEGITIGWDEDMKKKWRTSFSEFKNLYLSFLQ